jgi:hypothetical protein
MGIFFNTLKRHLEFIKLAQIMETKGNKILQIMKTRWISKLSLVKQVFYECWPLLMKMALDSLSLWLPQILI